MQTLIFIFILLFSFSAYANKKVDEQIERNRIRRFEQQVENLASSCESFMNNTPELEQCLKNVAKIVGADLNVPSLDDDLK